MLPLSPEMLRAYDAILVRREVASSECNDYRKYKVGAWRDSLTLHQN